MEDHIDYIEFDRINNSKVRIVFEMYRTEILFYHYEYRHDEHSDWKAMEGNNTDVFTYYLNNNFGEEIKYTIAYPTKQELKTAQEIISQRYYFWSI